METCEVDDDDLGEEDDLTEEADLCDDELYELPPDDPRPSLISFLALCWWSQVLEA